MSASMPHLFVAVGPDWGGHPCTLSHIMNVVVKSHPVIWVNSMAQRSPRLSRHDMVRLFKKATAALMPHRPGLRSGPIVVHPRAIPYHQFAAVRSLNGRLIAQQLRPIIARYPGHKLILVGANPAAVALIDGIRPDATIYFCMDDYAQMQDSDGAIIEVCERLMLARASMTVVTSKALVEKKTVNGKVPAYIPQGVDIGHFATPGLTPDALARIPRPIIGFQGIVGPRVDLSLLEKIAIRFPHASLVTIGKEEVDMARLKALPNVYALGPVDYRELPAWIQAFDIGLVAYRYDGHTESVNPLKLLEYLALGQEVVSVSLPELAQHSAHVQLATDHASYLSKIADVLSRYPFAAADIASRKAYAAQHSWEGRARSLLYLCEALLSETDHRPSFLYQNPNSARGTVI